MVRMTLSELYLWGKKRLLEFGIESAAFEALALMEPCFGIKSRDRLSIMGSNVPESADAEKYISLIDQRKTRPLQYILGSWSFCGMELEVGEGVLVPREDTEVLVQIGAEFIKDSNMRVLDLCSGSGAVALGIVSKCPNARVTAVELSSQATVYLERNIQKYGDGRCEFLQGDITDIDFSEKTGKADVILSNPPYIPTEVIKSLSADVKREPVMALDGGADGLLFYRIITENYKKCLVGGGLLAVEVGYDQSEAVQELFKKAGFINVGIKHDLAGIERCVYGYRSGTPVRVRTAHFAHRN